MTGRVSSDDYLHLLTPWAGASAAFDYRPGDRDDLLSYGPGLNGWGVQTNQKALAALAVLAESDDYDDAAGGMGREELRERALAMLCFALASHIEGDYHCSDGTSWGHTWISVLGVERMMHAVALLRGYLSHEEENLLRRVLVSEARWLCEFMPVEGCIDSRRGPNRPESNIWNGALLHRVALMYPDEKEADAFREKGTRFLLNGISIPSDAQSGKLSAGKRLSEWHAGANFNEMFGLNHHGYLNIGYMVICLSNIAMLHFACKENGWSVPAGLYHHAEELWRLVKACTFDDGRLLRIGGDTRVRYCYCQDYAICAWLLAADRFGDADAPRLERGWLEQVGRETGYNGDGSFLSKRCRGLRRASRLYYTRLESDRAVTLSMGAHWRRVLALPDETAEQPEHCESDIVSWQDGFHGASLQRGARRVASFVWESAEKPTALCLPAQASDMAEWRENLTGEIRGEGMLNGREVIGHWEDAFSGGFVTCGSLRAWSREMVAEGQPNDDLLAVEHVACAVLPDDATMVLLHRARTAAQPVCFRSVKVGRLFVPNDVYNGFERQYAWAGGVRGLEGFPGREETVVTESGWVCVDDRLALVSGYGIDQWRIFRPGRRQIGMWAQFAKNAVAGGMLYGDEICGQHLTERCGGPSSTLFDVGFAVQVGVDRERTAAYWGAEGCRELTLRDGGDNLRGLRVRGQDQSDYAVIANFGETTLEVCVVDDAAGMLDLATNKSYSAVDGQMKLMMPPRRAVVCQLAGT